MAAATLKNMDVGALLTLRADIDKALAERSRDLQRQIGAARRRGRQKAGTAIRPSGAA